MASPLNAEPEQPLQKEQSGSPIPPYAPTQSLRESAKPELGQGQDEELHRNNDPSPLPEDAKDRITERFREDREALIQTFEQAQQQSKDFRQQFEQVQEGLEQLQQQFKESQQIFKELKEQLDQRKQRIEQPQQQIEQPKQQFGPFQYRNQLLKQEEQIIREAQQQLQYEGHHFKQVEQQIEQGKQRFEQGRQQLERRQEQLEHSQQQLQQRQQQLKQREQQLEQREQQHLAILRRKRDVHDARSNHRTMTRDLNPTPSPPPQPLRSSRNPLLPTSSLNPTPSPSPQPPVLSNLRASASYMDLNSAGPRHGNGNLSGLLRKNTDPIFIHHTISRDAEDLNQKLLALKDRRGGPL
ncbi:hypothetical protein EJ04DRAFT_509078 [Polyplosphaeria fusca]|uniref:Uncharacterized protein n=1 Tax=Polyplosphaeria fusca TaxID=682080 RepID=A0A9P4R8L2_9PLEO|nr:hypothetical protein EJ04DRAFT_509078 [Polyplosphaeria fusca]